MVIVLLGYMGSGKSTIGRELATVLDYSFLDLDTYIEAKENNSISDIFNSKGELFFRKKETECLAEILESSKNTVLALGGGTPCFGKNMSIINHANEVISFYLKMSIPNLTERLFNERHQRPLISHISSKLELTEFIGKHIFERSSYYMQADHTLQIDHTSKKELLESILVHLV